LGFGKANNIGMENAYKDGADFYKVEFSNEVKKYFENVDPVNYLENLVKKYL
jgi:hypothetical protein